MINATQLGLIKNRLIAYVKGWTAHALLKQTLSGEDTVTNKEFEQIITEVTETQKRKGAKVTLSDVIRGIVDKANQPGQTGIEWTQGPGDVRYKDVVVSCSGSVFHVIITKESGISGDNYSVDVQGELGTESEDLLKFHPPVVGGGKTMIHFDSSSGYTIDPGEGIAPIVDTTYPPRPLQLNTVRAYTRALVAEGSSPSQLALLGTGTGKSFIIASAAEAVGSSVIILPNIELANELLTDAMKIKIFSGRMVADTLFVAVGDGGIEVPVAVQRSNKEPPQPPYVVLADKIENPAVFKALVNRSDVHIILNADHHAFTEFVPLINDKLLMIDESHQHAYTDAQAVVLKGDATDQAPGLCDRNATLALTGTPTGALNKVFEGRSCVEFNLGQAMSAGLLRRLDSKTKKVGLETEDETELVQLLVDKAIIAYFKHVYLVKGDPGFQPASDMSDPQMALKNLVPPCQKAMIFSDDPEVLKGLKRTLKEIEQGTLPLEKLHEYQEAILKSRLKSLKAQTGNDNGAELITCDLQSELVHAHEEAIKNTIFSFALRLLMPNGPNRERFSAMLRMHTLHKLTVEDSKYEPLDDATIHERAERLYDFKDLNPAVAKVLKSMIEMVAKEVAQKLNSDPRGVLQDLDNQLQGDVSIHLNEAIRQSVLLTDERAVRLVNMDTDPDVAKETLARLKFGLASVALSDQRWATGVSIADVLTSIIVNRRLDFENHNAVCAPPGAAQAVGRAVRSTDLRGSSTIISSSDIPEELIFSVESIMSQNFGEQAKVVLDAWDRARKVYDETYRRVVAEAVELGFDAKEADEGAKVAAYQHACEAVAATLDSGALTPRSQQEMPSDEAASGAALDQKSRSRYRMFGPGPDDAGVADGEKPKPGSGG